MKSSESTLKLSSLPYLKLLDKTKPFFESTHKSEIYGSSHIIPKIFKKQTLLPKVWAKNTKFFSKSMSSLMKISDPTTITSHNLTWGILKGDLDI